MQLVSCMCASVPYGTNRIPEYVRTRIELLETHAVYWSKTTFNWFVVGKIRQLPPFDTAYQAMELMLCQLFVDFKREQLVWHSVATATVWAAHFKWKLNSEVLVRIVKNMRFIILSVMPMLAALAAIEASFINPYPRYVKRQDSGDPGEALYLTKYIESGELELVSS